MRVGISIFGREVLAVTIGHAGEAPDDHEDLTPDYELTSDAMPVERADWLDDDEDAPRPMVIVRGDHLRGRTTRTRRNPPPFIGSGLTRVDVRNGVKRSTPTGFGFHA